MNGWEREVRPPAVSIVTLLAFFQARERSAEWSDVITVSMLEVYNENIRDLLTDNGGDTKLEVKMGEFGNHVPGIICSTRTFPFLLLSQ